MTFDEHINEFAGKPVVTWERGKALEKVADIIYRISLEGEEGEAKLSWTDKFAEFLGQPGVDKITGLVVGAWDWSFGGENSSAPVVEALVSARNRLPLLKAIFLVV